MKFRSKRSGLHIREQICKRQQDHKSIHGAPNCARRQSARCICTLSCGQGLIARCRRIDCESPCPNRRPHPSQPWPASSSVHSALVSCLLYSSAVGDHVEPRLERRPCCVRCHLRCAQNIEESQITTPQGDGG